jgi:hypothetical protein
MPTNNAIDLNGSGICKYDGAGTFSSTTTTQHAVLIGGASNAIGNVGPLTNGQLVIGAGATNDPVAATLTAGSGITITNSSGGISIATSGGGLTWSVATGSTNMLINNGYGANGAGSIAFTLPTTAAVGSIVEVVGMAVGWSIVYGTGQEIWFGNTHTTATTGSLASTNAGDCVTLVCLVANTGWYVANSIGNITIA